MLYNNNIKIKAVMKIEYTYKEDTESCLTLCPFGNKCGVCSIACQECEFFVHDNYPELTVECKHP